MATRIITFTTDFGTSDGYTGIVKGVILGINPDAYIVDISHDVCSWDVAGAAWVVENAHRFFPSGTVHLCVVDPAVGSESQRGIALSNGEHTFVGPDNGLFTLVLNDAANWHAYELTDKTLWRSEISSTFHARDIYGPIAAHLSKGLSISNCGKEIEVDSLHRLSLQPAEKLGDAWRGSVVYIDKFGNLITNISHENIAVSSRCFLGETFVARLSRTYVSEEPGKLVAFVGSHGFLEIGACQARAVDLCEAILGTEVRLEP